MHSYSYALLRVTVNDIIYCIAEPLVGIAPESLAHGVVGDDSKINLWKFILQTLISILTAILTALGATVPGSTAFSIRWHLSSSDWLKPYAEITPNKADYKASISSSPVGS